MYESLATPTQVQQNMDGQAENQINIPQQQMAPENWQFGFDNMQTNPLQMNSQQQNTQVDQNQQLMTYQPGLSFDPTQVLQQLGAQQNVTQPPQNLNQQPMLNLDLYNDPVGEYVNTLNADKQELTQYNNLLWGLIQSGQSGNADQLGLVVAAAQSVVKRVFARELQDQANQFILNALGADERYLTTAQAFAEQLKRFNNVLEIIQQAGQ